MPASQTGFGAFILERSLGLGAGYQVPVLGCPPGLQPQPQLAAMGGVPVTYSGLPGYNFVPYAPHRALAPMNGFDMKGVSPYHHALLARGGAFFPPYRHGPVEDPGRAKVATRESTGALKAWLNEHLKNPYPTKGEKIMLAIITKMSLTQVSTWFANARRRLKKENRVSWASKGKSDEEDDDEEQEGDSDEEEEGGGRTEDRAAPVDRDGDRAAPVDRDRAAPVDRDGAAPVDRDGAAPVDRDRAAPVDSSQDRQAEDMDKRDCERAESKESGVPQKPKIWSLAETATSESVRRPGDSVPPPHLWAEWASRSGLFVPSCYPPRELV